MQFHMTAQFDHPGTERAVRNGYAPAAGFRRRINRFLNERGIVGMLSVRAETADIQRNRVHQRSFSGLFFSS